jgi:serine/threonine-protein kinase
MSEPTADRSSWPSGVGRYEIRSRLAADPLDEVYEGFDPLIERPVAVKVFSLRTAEAAAAAAVRTAFDREMPRVGMLTHPGIIALYDAGPWSGGLFMATEFVEGFTLSGALNQADLDLPLRVSLLVQIVDALEHARDLDVAHLNLKPSNIRVAPDYMLKVGSFGIAPVAEALAAALNVRPLPTRHMAPERVKGQLGDFRSDAYSIAQIALDILVGPNRPMPAGGWLQPPPLPATLADHGVRADRWETLFSHALAEDPDDRFPTVGAFNAELLMRLELNETEARLAWESSRAIGAMSVPDPTLLGTIVGSLPETATMLGGTPSELLTSSTSTTTTTADGPASDLTHGDSETVLGPAAHQLSPKRQD